MKIFNQMIKFSDFIKIKTQDKEEIKDENVLEYKILVLGEKYVGKSSICLRFAMNEFNLEIKPNTQCECYLKTLKIFDQLVRIYLIDVEPTYDKYSDEFKKFLAEDLKGIIIVYDITKTKSLEVIEKKWNEVIKKNFKGDIPVMLLGNKQDLKFLRNIDTDEAKEKANSLNFDFFETDCISKDSVKENIKYLIARIYYEDLPENKKNEYKEKAEEEEKNEENINDKKESVKEDSKEEK